MIKLSCSVMTHPKRLGTNKEFFDRLPDGYKLSIDHESHGHAVNGFNAFKLYEPSATHHIVFEDDIVLSKDFFSHVKDVLTIYPTQLLMGMSIRNSQISILNKGYHFANVRYVSWHQAIIMPVPLLEIYISEYDNFKILKELKDSDNVLSRFCNRYEIPIGIMIPNLVQHLSPERSLLGHPPKLGHKERKSPVFIDDYNFDFIDWSKSYDGYI